MSKGLVREVVLALEAKIGGCREKGGHSLRRKHVGVHKSSCLKDTLKDDLHKKDPATQWLLKIVTVLMIDSPIPQMNNTQAKTKRKKREATSNKCREQVSRLMELWRRFSRIS